MPRPKTYYICSECGYKSAKWMGRCLNCGAWNTFQELDEEAIEEKVDIKVTPSSITDIKAGACPRLSSGIGEFDRVLGGGVVPGSLILLGGAPGIGKSTLVLQMARHFSEKYGKFYMSVVKNQLPS